MDCLRRLGGTERLRPPPDAGTAPRDPSSVCSGSPGWTAPSAGAASRQEATRGVLAAIDHARMTPRARPTDVGSLRARTHRPARP